MIVLGHAVYAGFLFYGLFAASHTIALRWLAREHPVVRWSGATVVGLWLATAIFHFLLPFSLFNRLGVGALLAIVLLAIHLAWHPWWPLRRSLQRDLGWLIRTARLAGRRGGAIIPTLLTLVGLVISARVALSVPAYWDTITYHYAKAGLWVQSGGAIDLQTPGGFAAYTHRLAGGEVLSAWAMLPTHGDLLAPSLDLLWWLGVGVALYGLGLELRLRARLRWAAVAFASFTPAFSNFIGTGYVEPLQCLTTLLGLLFGVRFLRLRSRRPGQAGPALALSLVSFSLSAGIKVNAFPALALASLLLALSLRGSPSAERGLQLRWLLIGLGVGAVGYGPWLAWNMLELGRPFGFPLQLGPIELGAEPSMAWFMQSGQGAAQEPYSLRPEMRTLRIIFGSPVIASPILTALWLPPLMLGLIAATRRRPGGYAAPLLIVLVFLSYAMAFYTPSFSIVRLGWATTSSRYLLPGLLPLLLLGLLWLRPRGRTASAYRAYLLGSALLFAWTRVSGAANVEGMVRGGVIVIALLLGALLARHLARRFPLPALAMVMVLSLSVVPLLHRYREHVGRHEILRRELADWRRPQRYWLTVAEAVDQPDRRLRIAITGGRSPTPDQWFVYPLLGSRLQNELHYVSLTAGSEIIPMGPELTRELLADYEIWHQRLLDEGISHVVSFLPPSTELGWMEQHPEAFERIEGVNRAWGVYSVRAVAAPR